jgi:FkbM family methyltransferase
MIFRFLRLVPEALAWRSETPQWRSVMLAYLGVKPVAFPYELRLRGGACVTLREPGDLVLFWLVFARRHYPVDPSWRTIVDAGANVGLFTLYAARRAPLARIVAVEPFPDSFDRLRELVGKNGLEDRVTLANLALSSKNGEAQMDARLGLAAYDRHLVESSAKAVNANTRAASGPSKSVQVRAASLAAVLDQHGLERADMVKMNIHGSEYDALLSLPTESLVRLGRVAVHYRELPKEAGVGWGDLQRHFHRSGFVTAQHRKARRGSGPIVFAKGYNGSAEEARP